MGRKTQNARIQFKYSTISGTTPTIAPSNDHSDGTWSATDLYVGEFFLNAADDTMWVRTLTGIIPITSGTTSVDINQFVDKTGDIMTGGLTAPSLSATTIEGGVFSGDTYYGDGSNLTGIVSNGIFTGGTVNGDTEFTADVQFSGANVTLPVINGGTQVIGDIEATGSVTATTFYGDGSQLTGLNLSGLTTDTYVESGELSGDTLTLTRNDLVDIVITGFTEGPTLPPLNDSQILVGSSGNTSQAVSMTGDVNIDNTGVTTIQPDSVTYDKMQDVSQAAMLGNTNSSGGTVSEIPILEEWLSAGAITTLLEDTTNWDINGNYTGTTITGTYQSQKHYNNNYLFMAVDDNLWIRLIRG